MSMWSPQRSSPSDGRRSELGGQGSIYHHGHEFNEHTHTYKDFNGQTWAWLTVRSRAKGERPTVPMFFQGDMIRGTIGIDFDVITGAKGVKVEIVGEVIMMGQQSYRFLEVKEVVWDAKESGDRKHFGKNTFPFSLAVPSDLWLSEKPKMPQRQYRSPPSFIERTTSFSIDYKIMATVKRGSLKASQFVTRNFVYLPVSRAEFPSPLRQISYRDHRPCPSPHLDPEGWKVLPQVGINGTLFDTTRNVGFVCTLAVAHPLSFAMGSPIPLFITISSPDQQALELLSEPSAVRVDLIRERLLGPNALKDTSSVINNSSPDDLVGTAIFWPADAPPIRGKRMLQGEIEISKGLKPSFFFPHLSIQYSVVLRQFKVSGFTPVIGDAILLSQRVTIHTLNATSVTPISSIPPGYLRQQRGSSSDVASLSYFTDSDES